METTIVYWGYIGIVEKKMETTMVYWVYIGLDLLKLLQCILSSRTVRKALWAGTFGTWGRSACALRT